MGESRNARFVPVIRQLLERETNQNVRESAIKALGKIGGAEAVRLLWDVLQNPKEPARFGHQAARRALQRLGHDPGPTPPNQPPSAAAVPPPGAGGPPGQTVLLAQLRQAIVKAFDDDELRIFCQDLDGHFQANGIAIERIDWENMGGRNKEARVHSLIRFMDARRLLPHLVSHVREKRPGII